MTENTPTAEPPPPEGDPLVELALQPWRLAEGVHDAYVTWWHHWAQFCLRRAYPLHPHEAPEQLEIPDPIATKDEQDLFA